ncbi:hypothetical protein BS17DRAFT_555010 [Gyrodon lividus]|nr:hypothetical protein BS17DRAFT_555010 [Gyrodon lividus]
MQAKLHTFHPTCPTRVLSQPTRHHMNGCSVRSAVHSQNYATCLGRTLCNIQDQQLQQGMEQLVRRWLGVPTDQVGCAATTSDHIASATHLSSTTLTSSSTASTNQEQHATLGLRALITAHISLGDEDNQDAAPVRVSSALPRITIQLFFDYFTAMNWT